MNSESSLRTLTSTAPESLKSPTGLKCFAKVITREQIRAAIRESAERDNNIVICACCASKIRKNDGVMARALFAELPDIEIKNSEGLVKSISQPVQPQLDLEDHKQQPDLGLET
jgi:hypothetical protein